MKKLLFAGLSATLLSACALLGPTITFTTPNEAVIDPAVDTLDLAVSQPMMAYLSQAKCEGQEAIEILPVITEDMESTTAHNLPLSILDGQNPGTRCELTVSVYNQSTTTNFSKNIDVYVLAEPVEEVVAEEVVVEEEVTEVEAPLVEEETPIETEETNPAAGGSELTQEECLAAGGQYVSKMGEGEILIQSCELETE